MCDATAFGIQVGHVVDDTRLADVPSPKYTKPVRNGLTET